MPAEAPPAPLAPPAAAPPQAPEHAPADFMQQEMADFAEMDKAPVPPAPSVRRDERGQFKPAEKPAEKPAPPKAPDKPTEKPPEKPEEIKPADKAIEEPPKPVKAAELRNAYDGLKKKVREELEPELQRLRSRVQEYENKGPEETLAPLVQKLQTLQERNAHLEKVIELQAFEESDAYKKHVDAYNQMWNRASGAFNQLTVKEPAGVDDMGEPKFTTRRASEADLIKLGALPLSELDEEAQKMFGASAPRAIQYIERLRDLAETRENAKAEAARKGDEWKSQRKLEEENQAKLRAQAWNEINNGLKEKWPKAFQPEEGNSEDAAAHSKGFALADLLFLGNAALTPEQVEALPEGFKATLKSGKPLTEIQKVQLNALARIKMANHDRLVAARKADKARIAELEKIVADYEKSEPATDRAGEGGKISDKPWDQVVEEELRAMDK